MSSVRVTSRNVKKPELSDMCLGWTAGLLEAETLFRKAESDRSLATIAVTIEQDLLRRRQRITHNPVEDGVAMCTA